MLNYTKVYSVTMTSGQTLSAALDLSKTYDKMALVVPTMASGSLFMQGSHDGVTYFRVTQGAPNQSTDFSINSAATQRVIPLPYLPVRYMKIESSSGCTDVLTVYKVICAD
jgi:hypothetical protein